MGTNDLDTLQQLRHFSEYFDGNFSNVLWQILINKITAGKVACLVSNYDKIGHVLGMAYANEYGYTPSTAYFKQSVSYDESQKIIDALNQAVFNLDELTCFKIQASSMRKPL